MKPSSSKFTNELGNDILIRVKKNKNDVNIKIQGPKSVSENVITHMEAKELLKALKQQMSNKYLEKIAKMETYYHGTTPLNAKKINKRGLIPNGSKAFDAMEDYWSGQKSPRGKVYLTKDVNLAARYADGATKIRTDGKEFSGKPRQTEEDINKLVSKFKSGYKRTGIVQVKLNPGKFKTQKDHTLKRIMKAINGGSAFTPTLKRVIPEVKQEVKNSLVVKGRILSKYIKR